MNNNKKGALELSVTAIVILIIGIVMLGLGLAFVRGMFSKVQTSFEEAAAAEPEAPDPSGGNPITLSRESMIVHRGDTVALKVGIFNPSGKEWTSVKFAIDCTPTSVVSSDAQFNEQDLPKGESFTGIYLFKVGGVEPKTYLCDAKSRLKCISVATPIPECTGTEYLDTGYSKDIIITVRE